MLRPLYRTRIIKTFLVIQLFLLVFIDGAYAANIAHGKATIVLLCGSSTAGKSTICEELIKEGKKQK